MDWFLYDNGLRRERVKQFYIEMWQINDLTLASKELKFQQCLN